MSRQIKNRIVVLFLTLASVSTPSTAQSDFGGLLSRTAEQDFQKSLVTVQLVHTRSGVMLQGQYVGGVQVREIAKFRGAIIDSRGFILSYVGGFGLDEKDRGTMGVVVETRDKRQVPARIVGMDQRVDLVLLYSESLRDRQLTWADAREPDRLHFVMPEEDRWKVATPRFSEVVEKGWLPEWELRVTFSESPGRKDRFRGSFVLNQTGNLVGIATRRRPTKYQKTAVVGFIPSEILRESAERVMKERGNIYAGWLGIQQNMEHSAPYVAQVLANSPAKQAGLRPDDRIEAVDGQKLEDFEELRMAIRWRGSGNSIELGVLREGRSETFTVELCERRDENIWAIDVPQIWGDQNILPDEMRLYRKPMASPLSFGLEVDVLTPELAPFFRSPTSKGLWVKRLAQNSPAESFGFEVGDVLVKVNGRLVDSISGLTRVLHESESETLVVGFYRQGKFQQVKISLH